MKIVAVRPGDYVFVSSRDRCLSMGFVVLVKDEDGEDAKVGFRVLQRGELLARVAKDMDSGDILLVRGFFNHYPFEVRIEQGPNQLVPKVLLHKITKEQWAHFTRGRRHLPAASRVEPNRIKGV